MIRHGDGGEQVLQLNDAVHVAGGGLRAAGTMHTVHTMDLFKRDFLGALGAEELGFTAVHMQLPSTLGNKELVQVWLRELMVALLEKPLTEQLTMKITICFISILVYTK